MCIHIVKYVNVGNTKDYVDNFMNDTFLFKWIQNVNKNKFTFHIKNIQYREKRSDSLSFTYYYTT